MNVFRTTLLWKTALAGWDGIHDAPSRENRPRRFGIRVMRSPVLERFLVTAHWTLPGLWSLPLVSYLLYRSAVIEDRGAIGITMLFLAGMLGWTFAEYWLHRWVFHLSPSNNRVLRAVQFALHGYHHEFPDDPRRLVAPPILAVPIGGFLALVVIVCFAGNWPPILAGTFFGYLCYDWMHYYAHHGRPRFAAGKFMRRFHLEHHYKSADIQFGLSSPLWDLVFSTYRRPSAPTTMERNCLGQDADIGT
jgi:sterol desaturase/sphingolipid hydroxylase (fatty acid hydroxylase superfamily)